MFKIQKKEMYSHGYISFFLLPSHIESNINFKPKITNNYETL